MRVMWAVCGAALVSLLPPSILAQAPQPIPPEATRWHERLRLPYEPARVPPVRMENSPRIESLMRDGSLYLSLDDAIALALENNLDVELQRYAPAIAQTDLLRAQGGASTLRGIPSTINLLPQGIGGPSSPILNLPASGTTPNTTVPTSLIELSAITPAQTNSSIAPTGGYSTGPAVPIFDPSVVGNLGWQRQSIPQSSLQTIGTSALHSNNFTGTLGVQKGLDFGTSFGASFNSASQDSNSLRTTYNPFTTSALGLTLTQPLLRGFGPAVNRRFIRIARNNGKVSDELFRQQVIETVAGVVRLYFDLVSLEEDVAVKRQSLSFAERLYADNKVKVDNGTLAPIELVRAQAQIAASKQDLANSVGFVRQQELILKNVITRRGTADPAIRAADIRPTTPIEVPEREPTRPVEDLVDQAYRNRPELEQARLVIANGKISLEGSRNGLLPQFDLVGAAQNSGLGGQLNPLSSNLTGGSSDLPYIGGPGSALSQIFRRNYPSYAVGVQLNLPLRNRIAQGDYARDEINLRQTEIRLQQLSNQVRLEVEGALIALNRARGAYEAATEARKLQEQSLEIELEKFQNGLSTNFLVMQYQTYVAQARSTEVAARGVYVKARNALERATGETLPNHHIELEQVMRGRIATPPSALP